MKAFLRDNQSFIALSSVPKKDIPNGLAIIVKGAKHETDIHKGQMRYEIPPFLKGKITHVEIVND